LQDIRNHPWLQALRVYTRPQVMIMLFLGFSAGLPFLLVFSTLSAWLTDAGTSRTVIGFFSWVGITYSIKFFWAPVVDRLPLPILTRLLGRRRSWMLLAQIGIASGLAAMALLDPATQTTTLALFAILVAFSSATQDIAIDAWRIEAEQSRYQGAMAAAYVGGYRVALLVAGAGAFYLADFYNWHLSYQVMALLMGIGIVTTLVIREPDTEISSATQYLEKEIEQRLGILNLNGQLQRLAVWFSEAVVAPFVDFFSRNGREALVILALISVYKLSEITMGTMSNPFYLDLGFTKSEIASVAKVFGFGMTIAGAAIGGLLVARYGLMRPLLAGAILITATNLLFAILAITEPSLSLLALVISADNLSGGFATAAFIAWLSSLTNTAYTATQYALFSSLMTLLPKIVAGMSGIVVDAHGYFLFFIYAGLLGIPAILLSIWFIKNHHGTDLAQVK
jgi:PAT family beta-lactamase induction signal transducer AmpG